MVYFFGPAELIDRKIQIKVPDENRSTNIVRYKLEERTMSFNNSRFIYTVSVFDCPRPIVELKKRKPAPVITQPVSGAQQSEHKEERS